jgi:ferredoxin
MSIFSLNERNYGSCGRCRCKILEGKIRPEIDFNYVLDPVDVALGFVLACQSTAKTDIKVSVDLTHKRK